jgi:Leucine-rich repeat (LRR) protein
MNAPKIKTLLLSSLILCSLSSSALATDLLSALPDELFLEISKYLNSKEQQKFSGVNQKFRNVLVYEGGKKINLINRKLLINKENLAEDPFQIIFGPGSFFSNAKEVNLSRSTFSAESLKHLSPDLEWLDLSYSMILGDPSEYLSRFTHLKTLILRCTHMGTAFDIDRLFRFDNFRIAMLGQIPETVFSALPASIEVLELAGTKNLKTRDLQLINQERLPHLKYLGLSEITTGPFSRLGSISASFLLDLPQSLEHLNLAGSQVESLEPLNSDRFPNLKFLDLSGMNDLNHGTLLGLPVGLEWLDLADSRFSDATDLLTLSRFQNLKGLSLNSTNPVTEAVVDEITSLKHLEILDLGNLGGVVTEYQINSFKQLPFCNRIYHSSYGQKISWVHLYGPNPPHLTSMAKEKASKALRERAQVMGMYLN